MMYARGSERASRRRAEVEGPHLNIYLAFSSVASNKAGYIMNAFQNNLDNARSGMYKDVALFSSATMTKLEVDGCNGVELGMVKRSMSAAASNQSDLIDMLKEEESSAARPTALLAL